MLNITSIPAPRVPFIDDRTGLMSREWYRFFLNLFVLTGSGSNDATIADLLIAPQTQDLSGDFVDTATQSQLASLMARYGNLEDLIQGAYLAPAVQTGTLSSQDASNVTVGTLNADTINAGTLTVYQTGTTTAQETIRNDTVTLVNNAAASTAVAGTTTNHDYYLYANNVVQAVVSKDGGMFIGCTATPSSIVSGIRWNNALTAAGPAKVSAGSVTTTVYLIDFVNGNGVVGTISTNGTATTYSTSSDYRLKTNVKPMQNALDKVDALNPVTFDWVTDGAPSQGFIAHELQAVVPECVVGEKDAVNDQGKPIYQSIDTSFLVATLTAAVKELKSEVDALKRKI
jgi:hypothetical protein